MNRWFVFSLTMLVLAALRVTALSAQDFPFPAPVLLDPTPGEIIEESNTRFAWGPVEGFDPQAHVYRLFITKLPSTTPGGDLTPIDATKTVAFVILAAGANYNYTVQVFEAAPGGAPLSPQPPRVQFQFPFPAYPTFTPTATGIPTPPVDYNNDSTLDYRDLWIFAQDWGETAGNAAFPLRKDLISDGVIDQKDLALFIQVKGNTLDTPLPVRPDINGATFTFADFREGRVIVEWTPVREAAYYTVQVEGPRASFPIQYFRVNAPQVTQVMGAYTQEGTYTWYVYAFAADGRASLASPRAVFFLGHPSPPTPTKTFTPTRTRTPTITMTPTPTPTEPFVIDINGDQKLTVEDVFEFTRAWATRDGQDPNYNSAADLTHNGAVDYDDFYILHKQWLLRKYYTTSG